MTKAIDSLSAIAADYDAIVFDQWGVLHNGSTAYPGAIACLEALHKRDHRMAVLSNSGKSAKVNQDRIAAMGFDPAFFECVMTSGEALWSDIDGGHVAENVFFPIERSPGDAAEWAQGLNIDLTSNLAQARAILLMGLPDASDPSDWEHVLSDAILRNLPLFCTNPDRHSPRAGGLVIAPGTFADSYRKKGGRVQFYGKPHAPVFKAIERALGTTRLLMVGDSLEHDIAGARAAGWDSLFLEAGLYADRFKERKSETVLSELLLHHRCPPPDYRMRNIA
ncbi:MAG: TIGR01459 family HAD-type hydrolase [Pseudomonadota bacterium]